MNSVVWILILPIMFWVYKLVTAAIALKQRWSALRDHEQDLPARERAALASVRRAISIGPLPSVVAVRELRIARAGLERAFAAYPLSRYCDTALALPLERYREALAARLHLLRIEPDSDRSYLATLARKGLAQRSPLPPIDPAHIE